MTAEDFAAFVAWAKEHKAWTKTELSRQLGCGINQIKLWADNGAPAYIGLACAALARNMGGWRPKEGNKTGS